MFGFTVSETRQELKEYNAYFHMKLISSITLDTKGRYNLIVMMCIFNAYSVMTTSGSVTYLLIDIFRYLEIITVVIVS